MGIKVKSGKYRKQTESGGFTPKLTILLLPWHCFPKYGEGHVQV